MSGTPTLNDVAKKAGVALDTARRALDGNPSVRSYLKEMVEAAAKELGYRPNLVARALKEKSLWVVPISVIDLATPYFGELALQLSAALVVKKLEPVLCVSPEHLHVMSHTVSARGCILANGLDERKVRSLIDEMKVATINSSLPELPGAFDVATDFAAAYREICRLLLSEGRSRVLLYSPLYAFEVRNHWINPKTAGMLRACREMGMTIVRCDENEICAAPQELASAAAAGRPEAILCENDLAAGKICVQLLREGYRIPEDIRLVGCDRNYLLPGLWTLDLKVEELAQRAVDALVRLYGGQIHTGREYVVPSIVQENVSIAGCNSSERSRQGNDTVFRPEQRVGLD